MTPFNLDQVQFTYEAEFFPPVLEIAAFRHELPFIKKLLGNFALRLGEVVLAPQTLSRNLISFRKLIPNGGYYDVGMGTDALTVNSYNPTSLATAWEPVEKAQDAIAQCTEFTFDKQILKFQAHLAPEQSKASEFIARYNVFTTDLGLLSSKGVTFIFSGPTSNSQTLLVLSESALIKDGLYVFSETTYVGTLDPLVDVFSTCVSFLEKAIFPALDLEVIRGDKV